MTLTCGFCGNAYEAGGQAARRRSCDAPACTAAREVERRALKAVLMRRLRAGGKLPAPATALACGGPSPRRCLRCDALFASAGAHHRICTACKDSEPWRRATDEVPLYW